MPATVLVGTQWGDEGKGKVTDLVSGDFDCVCRYQGGANAGHTVVANGHKLALHQIPSGVMYPGALSVIGNGCIVDPSVMLEELDTLQGQGITCEGLRVSGNAHIVMPYHRTSTAPTRSTSARTSSAPPSAASAPATWTR